MSRRPSSGAAGVGGEEERAILILPRKLLKFRHRVPSSPLSPSIRDALIESAEREDSIAILR